MHGIVSFNVLAFRRKYVPDVKYAFQTYTIKKTHERMFIAQGFSRQ